MESIALIPFAIGTIILLALGMVTLFFGISADEDADLPFSGKPWLRPVVIAGLLGVASGWPFIASGRVGGWVLAAFFVGVAVFAWYRGGSGQAPNKSFKGTPDGAP